MPARDEAERIGPLLAAVVGAPGVVEVVVVDDRSSDATAGAARDLGARVVEGAPRPPGWAGKTWALQQGVDAASAEWVVALDADTRPDPDLPSALVARALADGTELLTVGGRFECPTVGARWLHPAMLTTLVYRYGPPGAARPVRPDRLLANGQCTVARREQLLGAGGFAPVAGEVVEDVALARELARRGWRVDFLDAGELLTVRMYDDLRATWTGWGRSLGLPGVDPRGRRALDVAILTLTMPLPIARLLTGRADPVDAALLVARLGTLVGTRPAYNEAGWSYWLSPLADGAAVAALVLGLVRRRQRWRGRVYTTGRTPRSGGR